MLIRLSVDLLLLKININPVFAIVWESFTSLLLIALAGFWLFSGMQRSQAITNLTSERFLSDTKRLLIIVFTIIALLLLDIQATAFDWFDDVYTQTIWKNLLSVLSTLVFVFILSFLYKWLMARRTKRSTLHIAILMYIIAYFVTYDFLLLLGMGKNTFTSLVNFFMVIAAIYLIWSSSGKANWITSLTKRKKWELFFLSFFQIAFSVFVIIVVDDSTIIIGTFKSFFEPLPVLVKLAFTYLGVYNLRLITLTIGAIPTSEIVERKNTELQSIAFLNKYIADSQNKTDRSLLETVTKIAQQTSGAHAAWIEIYSEDVETLLYTTENVSLDALERLHSETSIKKEFLKLQDTILIKSVPENDHIYYLTKFLPHAKSLIASPILANNKRVGTIVVFDSEEYSFESDDVNLLNAFSDNVRIALDNARLVRESIDQEKYKNELMLAHEMQNKLLPQSLPSIDSYSVAAFTVSATEVGGDYYDHVYLKNNVPCLLIGDVSGKGISAAFYMAQLKGTVLALASECTGPAELLKRVNSVLYKNMDKKSYITMSAISFEGNRVTHARSGHMPLLVSQNNSITFHRPDGLGIGLVGADFFDSRIVEEKLTLALGNLCLLYTDGINELRNAQNEEFGFERLKQYVLKNSIYDAEQFTLDLKSFLMDYSKESPRHDDMTLITVIYKGSQA